jgi:predicted RNase H-like HicB family nuclease
LLNPEEGGYSVLIPVLGVATQGETVEEALAMAQDLIQVATRGLIEDCEPVPDESAPPIVATVEVPSLEAVAG